ncbi:MAG: hypothetical protein WCW16_01240 [Candidatus Magasanikbacteria bacterium]
MKREVSPTDFTAVLEYEPQEAAEAEAEAAMLKAEGWRVLLREPTVDGKRRRAVLVPECTELTAIRWFKENKH